LALDELDPFDAIIEDTVEQEQLRPEARSAITPQRAKLHVEQGRHVRACAMPCVTRQEADGEAICGTGARLREIGARFCASPALRRLRHDYRRCSQLLFRLLETDRVSRRFRLLDLRDAA
jgi:hypothetical protein